METAAGVHGAVALQIDRRRRTSDDKSKTGGQDRTHIALSEDYEVHDWAKKFGVSADELRAPVKPVGNKASDVDAHLKAKRG